MAGGSIAVFARSHCPVAPEVSQVKDFEWLCYCTARYGEKQLLSSGLEAFFRRGKGWTINDFGLEKDKVEVGEDGQWKVSPDEDCTTGERGV